MIRKQTKILEMDCKDKPDIWKYPPLYSSYAYAETGNEERKKAIKKPSQE